MNFFEVHSFPTMLPSFNMYLHVLLFLSWLLLPQATLGINTTTTTTITTAVDAITNKTFFIAKPGCNLTCGNLTVPYPFGIGLGSGCSIDPETVEILSISQTQVWVRNDVARACYDNNGDETTSDPAWIKLGDSAPYTFSDVANKFTVVGCDDYAWILGTFGDRSLSSACMSQCTERKDVSNKTGYCQTDIPKGLTYYNIYLHSFINRAQVSSFNPCSYAFLGETDIFKFNGTSDFEDTNFQKRIEDKVPVVLDYVVDRNKTCEEARNSNTSLCLLDNASCIDSNFVRSLTYVPVYLGQISLVFQIVNFGSNFVNLKISIDGLKLSSFQSLGPTIDLNSFRTQ